MISSIIHRSVVFLCAIFLFACFKNSADIQKFNNERSFHFTYKVDIKSTRGQKLELWIPIPQTNEVQTILNLIIDTHGLDYSIENENIHGNKYLYVNDVKGIIQKTSVIMNFDVIRKEHKNVIYENVDPTKYLGPYSMVPVDGVFKKIISENKLFKDDVFGIYDYVFKGMHYAKPKSVNDKYYNAPWLNADATYGMKKVSRDKIVKLYEKSIIEGSNYTFGNGNAIYACDIGVGNCTDYHSYFMSLNRTLEIPTRFHMGFSIPLEEEGKIGGYHCWSDYYVVDEGWYPVDISEADKDPDRKDYFFGTVCENRLEMMVGRDFKLKGCESETINFFIYPILEVNDEESSLFSKSFTYKNL